METRKHCAYNLTRESLLGLEVSVADCVAEPLAVLKLLIEGLAADAETSFWLTSPESMPQVPRLAPFDLAFVDKDFKVVQALEVFPDTEIPLMGSHVTSALVLPFHAISKTHTRAGDRLLVCPEEEMIRHLAYISATSGVPQVTKSKERAEESIWSPEVPYPAAPALPARTDVDRWAKTVPRPSAADPALPIGPTRAVQAKVSKGAKVQRGKEKRLRDSPPAIRPPAKDIEFTVTQAPIWRVSSPAITTALTIPQSSPVKVGKGDNDAASMAPAPVSRPKEAQIEKEGNICEAISAAPALVEQIEPSEVSEVPSLRVSAEVSPTQVLPAEKSRLQMSKSFQASSPPASDGPTEHRATPAPKPLIQQGQVRSVAPLEPVSSLKATQQRTKGKRHAEVPENHKHSKAIPLPNWMKTGSLTHLKDKFVDWLNADESPSDRRRAPRDHVPGVVAFYWTGGAPKEHRIADISPTGFYMVTEDHWVPETMLQMTLQRSPGKNGRPKQSITVLTRVVRKGADGVGHEFVLTESLNRHSREVLPTQGTDKLALERFL